eukprot:11885486-Ditylum_brightwellii.AAC.1
MAMAAAGNAARAVIAQGGSRETAAKAAKLAASTVLAKLQEADGDALRREEEGADDELPKNNQLEGSQQVHGSSQGGSERNKDNTFKSQIDDAYDEVIQNNHQVGGLANKIIRPQSRTDDISEITGEVNGIITFRPKSRIRADDISEMTPSVRFNNFATAAGALEISKDESTFGTSQRTKQDAISDMTPSGRFNVVTAGGALDEKDESTRDEDETT